MTRHLVPGTEHWFDLRDLSELTSDHQDEYTAEAIEIRLAKQEAERTALALAHPGMIPDPDQDIPVRLTPVDTRPMRDLLLSWILAGSSFPLPLAFPLPIVPWNVLKKALEPYYSALNGEVPDPKPGGTSPGTSASTSRDTAGAPPAASPPEP